MGLEFIAKKILMTIEIELHQTRFHPIKIIQFKFEDKMSNIEFGYIAQLLMKVGSYKITDNSTLNYVIVSF